MDLLHPKYRRVVLPALFLLIVASLLVILRLILLAFIAVSAAISVPSFRLASERAWSYLSFCLGVGGLTMATVQISRTLLPIRGYFHRDMLLNWLEDRLPPPGLSPPPYTWDSALRELGLISVSVHQALREFEGRARETRPGPESGLKALFRVPQIYDLPVEQLCGQLTVAFEAAVDQPQRFPNFLMSVSGEDGGDDLLTVVEAAKRPPGPPGELAAMTDSQARAALTRIGQMRIEAFQIAAGGAWRRRLRLVVLAVGVVSSWVMTAGARPANVSPLSYLFYSVLIGVIAAYLAMLLRDVAAIIEVKRRQG